VRPSTEPLDGGTDDHHADRPADRAATQVIGVAVLLGLTVVSLGALTAGIGAVVEENAASADAARVADGMDTALEAVERTGRARSSLAFTEGRVRAVERDIRVLEGRRTVERVEADALVWTGGDGRVASVAGAVVRGQPGSADLHAPPPVTASRGGGGVLVVGAPRLGADRGRSVSARGGATIPLRTNLSHEQTDLGVARFRVAIETRTPGALASYFREQGATTSRRDIDGDGVRSVVATYPGQRRAYLVVHDLDLAVGGGAGTSTEDGDEGDTDDDSEGDTDDDDDGPPVDPPAPDTPPGEGDRGNDPGRGDADEEGTDGDSEGEDGNEADADGRDD
jgi:hypothetical protein